MLSALFGVDLPRNAEIIMIMILRLVAFDFIHTEEIFEGMFHFRETRWFMTKTFESGEQVSKFAEAGYDSTNYWLMLGPLFFIILFFAIFLSAKKLVMKATKRC